MAIAFVQSAFATTPGCAFDTDNTAGNFLVFASCNDAGDVTGVTDTRSNSWAEAREQNFAGIFLWTDLWYAMNCAAGANTVTKNNDGFETTIVAEYSGVATSAALDQVNSGGAFGTSTNSGNITTTEDGELLIGVGGIDAAKLVTFGGSFTEREDDNNARSCSLGDRLNMAIGTYSTSITWSGNAEGQCLIASFKAATGVIVAPKNLIVFQAVKRAVFF